MQLRFAKAYPQIPLEEKWVWPWARELPDIRGFPFNIFGSTEVSDFKFGPS